MHLPTTSLNLISRLRDEGDHAGGHVSWKRFQEVYHQPLLAMTWTLYRTYAGHAAPSQQVIEDVVASGVVGFFKKDRFDDDCGRLRTYLRRLTNRVPKCPEVVSAGGQKK